MEFELSSKLLDLGAQQASLSNQVAPHPSPNAVRFFVSKGDSGMVLSVVFKLLI